MDTIFDILTKKYDSWYDSEDGRPLYKSELLCLRQLIEDAPKPILEIGVGTGRFAMHFSDITGIDPSVNSLRLAEKRGIKIVRGYGENLPFKNETFGCILIIFTLCFVQKPFDVLKEAKRVLKKDGSIIIGFIPKDSPWGIFIRKKSKGHPFYSHARFYTRKDIEKMLDKCGMRITNFRSTLLQSPQENSHFETPVEGFYKKAGFICIVAKIKYNL